MIYKAIKGKSTQKERKIENEAQKTITISYVRGISDKISRIRKHNSTRTAYKSYKTISRSPKEKINVEN